MIRKQNLLQSLLMLAVVFLMSSQVLADNKQIAFPGAEGFGRYVTGGRGGKVYHVTNLNDSGTGSLRWALSQSGKKIVVFDVSGTIHLKSALNIPANTTIAGQSAPGDGICVADYPCSVKGNNVIVRYMRFRLGNKYVTVNGADGWDGFGSLDCNDIIVDHCSVSWSIDECLSMSGCKNITVQWCLVAQSLVNSGHSKGNHGYGGNWGGAGSSYHHNLMVHHTSRTPRLGPRPTTQLDERMDMRNNVIYNWAGNGCYGGEAMKVNIVNNYYKPGPGTEERKENYQQRIAGIGIRTTEYITTYPSYKDAWHIWGKYYVTGNVNSKYSVVTNDNWTYGMYNQIDTEGNDGTYTSVTKDTIKIDKPIDFVAVTTHSAEQAYEKVLQYVGASLHRDSFDDLMISDTRDGKATYTGSGCNKGCINTQDDNKPAGAGSDWSAWPTLNSKEAPKDSDGDGMPDEWETAHGLNPNNASDGNVYGEGGYTNVEIYLNSLVEDITNAQNEGGVLMGETLPGESVSVQYTLSNETYKATENEAWLFTNETNDDEISVTGGSYKGGTYKFNTFLAERNKQYTIHLPEKVAVTAVTFNGYCNGTGTQTSNLSEVNGESLSGYTFPNRSKNELATFRIALSKAATETLTFTTGGQNSTCLTIQLEGVKEGDGISTPDPGPNPSDDALSTIGSGNVNWPFSEGTENQIATYSDDIAKNMGTNSVALGSGLSIVGKRTMDNIGFTSIQPSVNNEASANDNNAVTFSFTPQDGFYFQPKKVEFVASRIGTDGGQIDVYWQNNDGKTELASGVVPERNNNYTTFSEDIDYIAAATGTSSLIIHIYKLGNTKQIAIGNVVITGDLKTSTTGITTIFSNSEQYKTDNTFYNLQGERVQSPTQKGIYIYNGKKVIIK